MGTHPRRAVVSGDICQSIYRMFDGIYRIADIALGRFMVPRRAISGTDIISAYPLIYHINIYINIYTHVYKLMPASHCPEVGSRWTTKHEILRFLFLVCL